MNELGSYAAMSSTHILVTCMSRGHVSREDAYAANQHYTYFIDTTAKHCQQQHAPRRTRVDSFQAIVYKFFVKA